MPIGEARRTAWGGYLWLLPMLLFLFVVELWPFLVMLDQSVHYLSYTQPAANGQFIGLDNYRKAMHDDDLFHGVSVTLLYMLIALPVEFLLGLALAALISSHLTLKRIVVPLMLIPMVLAPVVVGLVARLNLNPDFGLLGIMLRELGFAPEGLLGSPLKAFFTIVAVDVWQWTPFVVMIFLAAIIGMPREPFEAAIIDGATRWQIFRRITLPLLRPIIGVVLLLRLTDAFKVFDQVFIMTGGGPGAATELLTIFAYKVNFVFWNLGYGSAVVALLFFISFVMTFATMKLITRMARTTP